MVQKWLQNTYKIEQVIINNKVMDLDHLQKLISKIELNDQSIHMVAQYCILNSRGSQSEIGKCIDKHFASHYIEQMLALLKLVSQIFVMTGIGENKETRFFQILSTKAKVYIEEITRRVKQIKPQHINIVPEILNAWARPGKEIFSYIFMDKLRKIAEPIIVLANKYQEERRNNLFQNYSKTFLMQYEDIRSYEPTSRIFDGYVAMDKISVEIGQINTEMKKLGLERMTPEIRLRAAELRKKLEKFTEKLQQIICKIHVDYKILREACKEEFEKLPAEAKQVLNKAEQ